MGDDEEPIVLGPEYEISDDEVEGELPRARIVEVDDVPVADDRNARQVYELELRPLPRDMRLAAAHQADASRLLALCLDPEPQVIDAVFDNALAGLEHARMAARHHGTAAGLDLIAKRAPFLRDTQVQRALLRNPLLSEAILKRILSAKPLRDVYKTCIDRELPDKNRAASRNMLRTRYAQAQSDERADLVVSTEGRCLTLLIGQTFDQRMTTILCSRQYNSSLFVQNLARFSACPPLLLAHLLKQPFVRRQGQLRKLLMQHPNMPSSLKR
jgi:hypothetical protein